MKLFKLSIVVVLLIGMYAIPALAGDFDIKFGLMKKDAAEKYYVYSETTSIPPDLQRHGPRLSVRILHKNRIRSTRSIPGTMSLS